MQPNNLTTHKTTEDKMNVSADIRFNLPNNDYQAELAIRWIFIRVLSMWSELRCDVRTYNTLHRLI